MQPKTRRKLQVVGPILLVGGFLLFIVAGIVPLFGFLQAADPDPSDFKAVGASFAVSLVLSVLSMPMIIAGGIMTSLGFRKPMAEMAATDTELAVETSAGALGRGLSRGGIAGGGIRVRCRSCGHLETEDARFCSGCAQPM